MCDLVGKLGQIRAAVDGKLCSDEIVSRMHMRYPNLWIKRMPEGNQYQPSAENELLRETRRLILFASYGDSPFSKLADIPNKVDVWNTLYSYMGDFPTHPPISALIDVYPQHLPPVSSTNLIQYEQYLIRTVQPICSFYSTGCSAIGRPRVITPSSSFWVMMALPMQFQGGGAASAPPSSVVTDSDESGDSDYCCERIFDILSSTSTVGGESRATGIRPKEQLRVDPTYFPNTILLLSRYRKSSSVGPTKRRPTALMHSGVMSSGASTPSSSQLPTDIDEATFRRALASLNQHISPFEIVPKPEPVHQLTEEEIREAARNVITSYANRALSGPMAPSLCTIAESLLAATAGAESNPPPGFPPHEPVKLSSLLNFNTPAPGPSRIDPQLMFDLQQAKQRSVGSSPFSR